MEYSKAKNIRQSGLSSLIKRRMLDGNQSFTRATVGSISDKFKAKMTGLQEKFDPLNLAKKLTGGSNLAPALLGKMTGRKLSSIRYFTGDNDKKYKSLGPIGSTGESSGALEKLYVFMVKAHEHDKKRYALERSFREEQRNEEQKNHEQFVDVLKMYTRMPLVDGVPTVVEQKTEVDSEGLVSTIVDKLKSLAGIVTLLSTQLIDLKKRIVDVFKNLTLGTIFNKLKLGIPKIIKNILGPGLSLLSFFIRHPWITAALVAMTTAWYAYDKWQKSGAALQNQIAQDTLQRDQSLRRMNNIAGSYKAQGMDPETDPEYRKAFNLYTQMNSRIAVNESKLSVLKQKKDEAEKTEKDFNTNVFGDIKTAIVPKDPLAGVMDTDTPLIDVNKFFNMEPEMKKSGVANSEPINGLDLDTASPMQIQRATPVGGTASPNANLSKLIQESSELELKNYAINQETGNPVMFNQSNTKFLPDKVPSTPASVRDMSPRVKDSFEYLRKTARAY